jgi:enamine deaminase RidA (YjgF/YER057c/UK114 family)
MMMDAIQRIGPSRISPTRSRSVIHNGVVTTVATSNTKIRSLYEQAREALAAVDRNLEEAGTHTPSSPVAAAKGFVRGCAERAARPVCPPMPALPSRRSR